MFSDNKRSKSQDSSISLLHQWKELIPPQEVRAVVVAVAVAAARNNQTFHRGSGSTPLMKS
jgi:hypothetical protein